jgi:hypothetical protein
MTRDEIAKSINPTFPEVYAPTTEPTKLVFNDGRIMIGYFEFTSQSKELEKENKYTFIEFGEKNQNYRSTRDMKYVTIVEGDLMIDVEYPSYSSSVMTRLQRLKDLMESKIEIDWSDYKNQWIKSTNSLFALIMYKWLSEADESGLVKFSIIPVSRYENNLGEYVSSCLEINLVNGRAIMLEPVAGISSNYDGKLDFYLIGNVYKKVSIYRKLIENGIDSWVLALSYDQKDHFPLTQQSFLKQIDQWLQ